MYDSPRTSSPPPSPHKKHHRSHSPVPRISTLLPHAHHHHSSGGSTSGAHCHSQYSPSTRAADISRLLDPAYASPASSSGSSASSSSAHPQPRAYVDHQGDLHDPDFRDFPVLRPAPRATHLTKRRRTSAGPGPVARARTPDRLPTYPGAHRRPSWERGWATDADDDDEDDDEPETPLNAHFGPFSGRAQLHSHTPYRRAPPAPSSVYAYKSYAPAYTPFYSEPVPLSGSPPGSLEDEPALQLDESPFGEDDEEDFGVTHTKQRRSSASMWRSRRSASSAADEASPTEEWEKPSPRSPRKQFSLDPSDTTPSCTYALRQQWEAIRLRVRFGVFHAKRRLTRRSST
ncbi:hypothetical protein CERSUDRAFT_113273 [Gelatoporia subvermispora B]|uniref:Uncharacterized protein n=1 Tax=Ceriporiopsis subvermispora (strain B) TaxID=914234 RepID=M2R0T0_CERS8|nr:hypothetical protein CERSUDRAFT_113273 [Gelatoporia subvermispora B]